MNDITTSQKVQQLPQLNQYIYIYTFLNKKHIVLLTNFDSVTRLEILINGVFAISKSFVVISYNDNSLSFLASQ